MIVSNLNITKFIWKQATTYCFHWNSLGAVTSHPKGFFPLYSTKEKTIFWMSTIMKIACTFLYVLYLTSHNGDTYEHIGNLRHNSYNLSCLVVKFIFSCLGIRWERMILLLLQCCVLFILIGQYRAKTTGILIYIPSCYSILLTLASDW